MLSSETDLLALDINRMSSVLCTGHANSAAPCHAMPMPTRLTSVDTYGVTLTLDRDLKGGDPIYALPSYA
jgi:hypothetical protein